VDEEEEDTRFSDTQRLLIRNETNERIFAAQQLVRKLPTGPPADTEEEDFEFDDIPHREKSAPRRPKSSGVTPEAILKAALAAGVSDSESLKAFMVTQTEGALKLFANHQLQLGIDETPLFVLGGVYEPSEVTAFWKGAKAQWIEFFGPEVTVGIDQFVKKIADAYRGPVDANAARALLRRTFGSDPDDQVSLAEFCGFLAQFGPTVTVFRKLNQFWQLSEVLRDALQPVDLAAFEDLALANSEEGNSFEIETVEGPKTVYNLVTIDADGMFLLDHEGRRYGTWQEFCDVNPPALIEVEVDESS
jgi:hypothetical protein